MSRFDWPQSSPDYGVAVFRDVMVPMRDGTLLAADVYRPTSGGEVVPGPFPSILIRSPYNKNSNLAANGPEFWARRGYVQVVQDVRGRFNSEGEFYLLRDEGPDGYDTIEWIAEQPWSDGMVGTMGTSYLAWVQSAAACHDPPHLKAMWVNQGAFNGLTSSLRQGGAIELRWLSWAFWGGAVSQGALRDPAIGAAMDEAATQFREWLLRLPWRPGETPLSMIPNYERWALDLYTQGLEGDELWQSTGLNFERHAEAHADVPTMYSGGWYDSYTRATTESFAHFAKHKTSRQHLLMGPWTHGDVPLSVTFAGDIDSGEGSPVDGNLAPSLPHLQLRFFDRYLKGTSNGLDAVGAVQRFLMGGGSGRRLPSGRLDHGGEWLEEASWPPTAREVSYHLHGDGSLLRDAPAEEASSSAYEFDPASPVPTISANISSLNDLAPPQDDLASALPSSSRRRNIVQQGGSDQRTRADVFGASEPYEPLASRADVLVFETEPLADDAVVAGPVTVTLWVSTSAVDTDFTAKLIDVYPASEDYPEGYALNLSDSIKRLRFRGGYAEEKFVAPDEVVGVTIELYPVSNRFVAGHRIRLDVSSSNFPRFDVNPNTGEPLGRQTRTVVARNTVYHEASHASRIDLPFVAG
ncbi:MAG: CocE/NonD family hydrolase [Chloroflexi bacterium]|nr:CocE/NonD family hydrolase [Chloroflexota bacterium]